MTTRLAGHTYQDPMCEACFRIVAPGLVEATLGLQPVASIEPLKARATASCANCGDPLHSRMVGHHRGDPLCVDCFREHSPDLAGLLLMVEGMLEAATASIAELRSTATCTNCGEQFESRFAGYRHGDPQCVPCFLKHATELGALLRLGEAALAAAEAGDFRNLPTVAVSYSNLLRRLDALHPRGSGSSDGST